jgi:hypothetical protein
MNRQPIAVAAQRWIEAVGGSAGGYPPGGRTPRSPRVNQ